MAKIGVCLSGCGVNDGAEIHESVITALALDRNNAEIIFTAPDVNQQKVVNHFTGDETDETRNVLIESARIARGNITDLADINAADMDGLIFPGGFGATLNLCDFAVNGAECDIHPEVARIIHEMNRAGKPIGVICIAPAMMAKAVSNSGFSEKLTIGNDAGTASEMEKLNSTHVDCQVDEIVIDEENKIVSTPAYMLAERISEAAVGIEKLVCQVLKWV